MPRSYPPEFRRKVLDLLTAGRTVTQVAADLQISDQAIYNWRRQELIEKLTPEFVPVAIWAYDLNGDYRYDTQFSPLRLAEWGISEEVFFNYIALQDRINPTVGMMLDYP